ncbi:hypothetical protein FJTKL_12199 [Diaporthe vaccinii]|uniref:Initiation-specific alpha-1,6-mannosyltransferase n=1 Tax=Diaporthe vaccinii TaxID=105482 RepID=A0ABR4EER7_9PEZI
MTMLLTPPSYSSVFTGIRGKPEPKDASSIPRKIWQIFSTPADFDGPGPFRLKSKSLSDTKSWLAMNPGYQYGLLGSKSADDFVNKHFSDNLSILEAYHTLQNPGMKTDLLRYLIMLAEGGVYSDLDTWALRPIDHRVPQYLRGSVRAVVGIEFDQLDGEFPPGFGDEPSYMTHVVQFCQWTLAAVPRHPIYRTMVDETVRAVRSLAAEKETTVSNLRPSGYEVIITTGPAAWTDVVFRQLQTADPNLVSLRQLSNMTQPMLIGDVLVLTIDGFGMGQEHSHSTNDGSVPDAALLKHNFRHSWLPQYP